MFPLRAACFTLAFLVTASVSPAPARAADMALDPAEIGTGEKGRILLKGVTLSDASLTREQAQSLFSGALPAEEAAKLIDGLSAREIRIPEVEVIAENGDRFTFHDIVASKVVHGGAESLAVASVDGVLPDDSGDATLHGNALRVENLAPPGLAAALAAGDFSLAAFRFTRLDWQGGTLSLVEKGTAAGAPGGNRILLSAAAARVDQTLDAEGLPREVAATLTGVLAKMPPQSKGGATMAAFGFPELAADARFSGSYDAAAKTYRVADYSLDFQRVGSLAFSGQFSGMDRAAFDGDRAARQQAVQAATVDWAQISVTDAGLFNKIVAFTALGRGQSPASVKSEWRAIVSQAPLLFAGSPAIGVAAKAVDRFIADPKNLTLRVKGRDAPLKIGDFGQISDALAFVNRLDIQAPQETGRDTAKTPPGGRAGAAAKP